MWGRACAACSRGIERHGQTHSRFCPRFCPCCCSRFCSCFCSCSRFCSGVFSCSCPIRVVAATANSGAKAEATQFFRNYTRLQTRVSMAVCYVARGLVLAVAAGLAVLLLVAPSTGLPLFWGLAMPLLPAQLVIATGLWRQVCPMATMNQLPRLAGLSRALDLPPAQKAGAFGISVALFVAALSLRAPLLNHRGTVAGVRLCVVLGLAFAGGFVFKGRSGWCGTFCPLAPTRHFSGRT